MTATRPPTEELPAYAEWEVTTQLHKDRPSMVRTGLRRIFRRGFDRLGVAGHPYVVVYRTEPSLLHFLWLVGPNAAEIGRSIRAHRRRRPGPARRI